MDAIAGMLQAVGIFVVGLVARVGLVLAFIAVLLAPVAACMGVARIWRAGFRGWKGYSRAGDLVFREDLHYAPGHTWLAQDGSRLRVGIDDLAQRLLPWALRVDLPRAGTRVRAGEAVASIACGGREARIAAPTDGTVVAVNAEILRDPSLVKRDCYARGWLFSLAPSTGRWQFLVTGEPARGWLAGESVRLSRFLEDELGVATADGGDWIAPPPTLLDPAQWQALMDSFFLKG